MENTSSVQPERLLSLLAQQVEDNRADLIGRYLGVLREALFSSRAEVHPRTLKQIAAEEVDVFLDFLRQPGFSAAKRGEQLHQSGFKAGTILSLIQGTRQLLLGHLESNQVVPVVEIVDAYQMAVIEGFIQSIYNTHQIERAELERVLNALHQHGHK